MKVNEPSSSGKVCACMYDSWGECDETMWEADEVVTFGDPGSAGSGWDKCVSQAHSICLILGGSAGRVSQSPPILVHCSASSFSKQPLTKCWNSWLYLWACILSELEQGPCLMYLLWYCIMSYRAPHMVCAVFVSGARSLWLSDKLQWVLFKELHCYRLGKGEKQVQRSCWSLHFYMEELN